MSAEVVLRSAAVPAKANWPAMLWLILAVALAVKACVQPYEHTTYPCFEAGARCWFSGANMYDFAVSGHDYRYTPAFTAAFTLLAWLPTPLGGAVWAVLNVGVLYWALRRLTAELLPGAWDERALLAFHALTLLAAIRGLWAAQSNTLIFSLLALGACELRRGRTWSAAFLLVAPAFIKVWPLAAALLFVACWPRQLLTKSLVAGSLLLALPFVTAPTDIVWNHHVEFLVALMGPMQYRHIYRDAWTIWETLAPPVSPFGYQLLQATTGLVTLALCVAARWTRCERVGASLRFLRGAAPRLAGFAREEPGASAHPLTGSAEPLVFVLGLWCVWQLVFGPGVERNTLCLIAPLLAWGVIVSAQSRDGLWLALAAYGLVVGFSFGALERALTSVTPLAECGLPLGVLCFGAWLLWRLRRAHFGLRDSNTTV